MIQTAPACVSSRFIRSVIIPSCLPPAALPQRPDLPLRGGNLHLFEMLMSGKQAMADRTAHYMNLISAGPKLARERHG